MTGLISGDPVDSVTLRAQGADAALASAGEVAAATLGSAWRQNPVPRILAAQERGELQWADEAQGMPFAPPAAPPDPMMPPEDANRKFGIPGTLTFDAPVTETTAASLHDLHHAEQLRRDTIERRTPGLLTSGAARMGLGFAAGLLDPLNIGASFIPVAGEARIARMLAQAGGAPGRFGVRAGLGAAQGAVGQAALEPLSYLLDTQEHQDWSAAQALRNIAFGGILGGGLHAVGGGVADALTGRFARRLEALPQEARETTLATALGQAVDGRAVDVAPLIETAQARAALDTTALRSAYADRLAARGETGAGNYAAYTPSGMRVELRPEVVELRDLIASHTPDGTVNPAFPHEEGMQPRDRSSAASQAQINELASRLEPERLGPSPEASTGAPIIDGNNIVESGNGRVLALHRVYSDPTLAPQAQAYRAFLEARGHDTSGMDAPVLVGRRATDLSKDDARAFARSANERATLGMNAAEQGRLDANRAGKAADAFRPGPINGAANRDFVAGFMAQVPAEERAGMILGNGQLSAQGEARIRGALLAHAYGDTLGPTLERILNGDIEGMKAPAGALTDLAGAWSQMRAAATSGEIPAGLDITPSIGEALQLLDRAHTTGTPIATLLAQADMLNRPSPAAEALLRLMFQDDAMRRPVARAKTTDLLDQYLEQAMQAKPGPGLFGEPETTAADILNTVAGDNARVRALADAMGQSHQAAQDLIEAARRSGADPEDVRVSAEAEAARKTPPAADALPDQQIADLESFVAAAREAGALDAVDEAALRDAADQMAQAGDMANAYQEAAACLLRGNA